MHRERKREREREREKERERERKRKRKKERDDNTQRNGLPFCSLKKKFCEKDKIMSESSKKTHIFIIILSYS